MLNFVEYSTNNIFDKTTIVDMRTRWRGYLDTETRLWAKCEELTQKMKHPWENPVLEGISLA